jgi:cobalamin biosynthesis protein CbiD
MGGKLMAFSILGSTGVLEHWSIEKAKLRFLECGLQNLSSVFDFVLFVFNPKSKIQNPKSKIGRRW